MAQCRTLHWHFVGAPPCSRQSLSFTFPSICEVEDASSFSFLSKDLEKSRQTVCNTDLFIGKRKLAYFFWASLSLQNHWPSLLFPIRRILGKNRSHRGIVMGCSVLGPCLMDGFLMFLSILWTFFVIAPDISVNLGSNHWGITERVTCHNGHI